MASNITFSGRFDHTLDDKNRLMVPQAFRDALLRANEASVFYLTRGLDECLYMYGRSAWEAVKALVDQRKEEQFADAETRKFFRLFYASAEEAIPDKTGRVLIPEHLKPIARLKRDVVLLGVSDKIEIWDKEQWEAFSRTEPGEYERSASKAFRRLV